MSRQKRRRKSRSRSGAGLPILIAIIVGMVLALGAAIVLTGDSGTETGAVAVAGEPLPPYGGAPDAAAGMAAPEVSGESFDGEPVEIAADGAPKAIVFLAHWCPHCQAEVPRVQAWLDEGGLPDGVEMLSVSTAADSAQTNYPPSAWLEREGWAVPVIVDDEAGTVATAYGLSGFPYWVFVDADGKVVGRVSGEMPIDRLADVIGELA